MQYPEEFKRAVLAVYPDSKMVKKYLNTGDVFLGRVLDDSSHASIPAERIVELFAKGASDKVLAEAENIVARRQLYAQWFELYKKEAPQSP